MSGYLVDTDWIIDVLHGQPTATQTLLALADQGLYVSLITYGELYQGAYYGRDPKTALRGLRAFLRGKRMLSLTRRIVERFAIVRGYLRQQGLTLGDPDILIAATAIEHDLTLLTRNTRHFTRIPGLAIYQSS